MKQRPARKLPAQGPRSVRRKRITQAARDVARGLKDTERRGIPSDVPAHPGGNRRR
jgi:hypothetical protein